MFRRVIVRLAILNVVILLSIVGVVLVAVFYGARYGIQRDVDRDLRQTASGLATSELTRMVIDEPAALLGTTRTPLTYVFDAEGELLLGVPSEEGDLPDLVSMRAALAGSEDIRDASNDDDSRVISLPIIEDGEVLGVVQVGRSIDSQREFLGLLWRLLAGVGLLAAAIAAGGGVFLASRAMTPIREAFDRQRGFISDASHELRTPIAVVRADADALARSLNDLSVEDSLMLDDMQSEADHMGVLVDRLVELARLDSGVGRLEKEQFDLVPLVEEVVRSASALTGDRRVQINAGLPDEIRVEADRTHVRTILHGLLENAVTHGIEPNDITVHAFADTSVVRVEVSDTGGGIREGHPDRVFERFYRGDPSRARNAGGIGLGLTIVKSLIELNGGSVELINRPGDGLTVRFSLPAASPGN